MWDQVQIPVAFNELSLNSFEGPGLRLTMKLHTMNLNG